MPATGRGRNGCQGLPVGQLRGHLCLVSGDIYSVPPERTCHCTTERFCPHGKEARSLHEEVVTGLSPDATRAGLGQEDRQQGHSRGAVDGTRPGGRVRRSVRICWSPRAEGLRWDRSLGGRPAGPGRPRGPAFILCPKGKGGSDSR